jgi:hypothetical protein
MNNRPHALEIANKLASQFSKTSSNANYPSNFGKKKKETERQKINIYLSNKEPFNVPLTEEKLDEALSECKGSSPGPDDIHYEFLKKNGPKSTTKPTRHVWRHMEQKNFPKEWRSAIVIPIQKPGKKPNKRRKLPTKISDELSVQVPRKDCK